MNKKSILVIIFSTLFVVMIDICYANKFPKIELTLDIASAIAIGLLFWQVLLQKKELQLQREELKNNREELKGQKEATEQLVAINQFQKDLAFAQEVELEMLEVFMSSGVKINYFNNSRVNLRHIITELFEYDDEGRSSFDKELDEISWLSLKYPNIFQKLTTIKTAEIREIYTAEDSIFKQLYDKCKEIQNS
jgi:hypothetical protein